MLIIQYTQQIIKENFTQELKVLFLSFICNEATNMVPRA